MILLSFADEARFSDAPADPVVAPPADPDAEPAAFDDGMDEDEERSVGDEVNDTVMELLPWGISFLFHMGLVLLALFIVWTATMALPEEAASVPTMKLSQTPQSMVDVTEMQEVSSESSMSKATVPRPVESRSVSESTVVQQNPTAIGAGIPAASSGSIQGTGTGNAPGLGVGFIGMGGNAHRIVFLVDASGSLIADLPFVVKELKKSISALSDEQAFQVIFYRGTEATGQSIIRIPISNNLIPASRENKAAALAWLDRPSEYSPGGRAEPVKAIQSAFQLNPELIFLLSDNIDGTGIYEFKQQQLLEEVTRVNTPLPGSDKRRAMINTIQFIDKPAIYTNGGKGTLQLLADQNGGLYKWVQEEEVGLGR